jgi:hypothetical protein
MPFRRGFILYLYPSAHEFKTKVFWVNLSKIQNAGFESKELTYTGYLLARSLTLTNKKYLCASALPGTGTTCATTTTATTKLYQ